MEQNKSKKSLGIGIPTYLIVITIIVLLCLFVPKSCQKKDDPVNSSKLDVICVNCSIDNQKEIHNIYTFGDSVSLTVKADEGCSLPNDIKATSGNQQLVKDTDYTYSKDTGKLNFIIKTDINIAINATLNECSLDVFCFNITVNEKTELHETYKYGDEVTLMFKLIDDEHYKLPDNVIAKVGDKTLVKDTDYTYSKETGEMKFVIKANVGVFINAIPDEYNLNVLCSNATVNGESELHTNYIYGNEVILSFAANEHYKLPNDVIAKVGDKTLVKDTDYTYSKETGEMKFTFKGATDITFTSDKKTLNECSWNEIKEISDSKEADTFFNVGDTKDVIVNNQVHKVRIIGFNQDQDKDGNDIGITFEFANLLSDENGYYLGTYWNDVSSLYWSNANYLNSTMRAVLNGKGTASINWFQYFGLDEDSTDESKGTTSKNRHFSANYSDKTALSMLPDDLKNVLTAPVKNINVATSGSWTETTVDDELFLLSPGEIGYPSSYQEQHYTTYQYYAGHTSPTDDIRSKQQVKQHDGARESELNGSNIDGSFAGNKVLYVGYNGTTSNYGGYYYLRSPYTGDYTYICYAWDVGPQGHMYTTCDVYCIALGISPCFCV